MILCTAIVYLLASIYSIGYMRLLGEDNRLWGFYALFAGFALTILLSSVMNNAGLYWIAIELTTLVSTFLVGFERAAESIEAAWKYIIIISAGISLALLGTVLFYWCGSFVLGPTYDMTWDILRGAAPKMNPALASLSFLLVLVGYGTKVGLAPMHAWLPDAHSESPAPISAMLSGALLNSAMLGIVRYLTIADAAQTGHLARTTLVVFGVLSLLVGALFIVRQNGIKRLMAYSSVEHMGVVALGFGFGGPLGIAGALYHMLNHSLNKSLMFFGAGNVMRSYGSKEIGNIHGVWAQFPVQGALWLAGAAAITGAPPFGLFLSELVILRAGFERGYDWAVYVMVVLLIVIFIGFLNHFRAMYFNSDRAVRRAAGAGEPLVRGADVARTGAADRVRRVVAERSVESFHGGSPYSGGSNPMTLPQTTSLRPAQLKDATTDLLGSGGRMQMAYAWYPEPHRLELRYTASPAGAAPFAIWRCDASEPVPSLAGISPLLSWYEREITDLFGLRFLDHPQPHRLVLHDGAQSSKPPFDPDYPPRTPAACATDEADDSGPRRRRGRRATAAVRPGTRRRGRIRRVSFLLHRRSDPALSSAAVLQASRYGKAVRGPRGRARSRIGGARVRRRQRGACARVLPGGGDRVELRRSDARESLAPCCSPKWSGFTIICIISAISATPPRSKSAKPKASCWRSGPSSSIPD